MTKLLDPGEPAPWFHAKALGGSPNYSFNTVAGRWVVMLLLGSAAQPAAREALDLLATNRAMFDDHRACFFGVSIDPSDAGEGRIAPDLPGIRWFIDDDRAISLAYGAARPEGAQLHYTSHWLLLDPMLRVVARAPLAEGAQIMALLGRVSVQPIDLPAPILVVPNIFPANLCRELIARYEADGGEDSGFMRDVDGVTVTRHDYMHKRRRDFIVGDQALIAALNAHLSRTLRPMIQRAFQFDPNRIERHLIACYDSADGGHFAPHRDNTIRGTAHRRFACTINLNAEDYAGGDLVFPEFGPRSYRAPTGGAVIFSCSLLHTALSVTRGRRYAFLPFFYDDEAARLRETNLRHVAPELQDYSSGLAPEAATD